MNRHELPLPGQAPDLSARVSEIRMPARATGHDMRNREEAKA